MFQAQINQEAQKFNATLGEWLTHQQIHSEKCGDTPVIAVSLRQMPGPLSTCEGTFCFITL